MIYKPKTIENVELPIEGGSTVPPQAVSGIGKVFTPKTEVNKKFPEKDATQSVLMGTAYDVSSIPGNVSINGRNLIAGSISVGNLGGGKIGVNIDGRNKRIIINDGITDRILIGYQRNGF